MNKTALTISNMVKIFADAVIKKDLISIGSLLHPDGRFEIVHEDLIIPDTDKDTFMEWFADKLKGSNIQSVVFDTCILCLTGNPVLIFNDGQFPWKVTNFAARSKSGLALELRDDKFSMIKFCYVFLKNENKYNFECTGQKIKHLMKTGSSFEEAYKIVMNEGPLE